MTEENGDRIRAAIRAHMAQTGVRPSRWSLDAGLSARALPHFLKGRSKTLAPESLTKLAKARKVTVAELLGFAPPWARPEVGPPGATGDPATMAAAVAAAVVQALAPMAEQLRQNGAELEELRRKVDELEKHARHAGGKKEP